MLRDVLKTLRINHYVKNAVVFVPLLISMKIFFIEQLIKALAIFLAFCFISSSVYILNDLIDIEKDRQHPIKKLRPIPSGRISKRLAITLLMVLLFFSSFISFKINLLCLITVISYFVLNILYSIWLKNIVIIDVCCIAISFILRILAGCFAICVLPSPLVILMTFFISNFFTFAKRKMELKITNSKSVRNSLKEMNIDTISNFILINVVLSVAFYITYVLDQATIERVGTQYLYITVIPFTLILYRLFLLIDNANNVDDPIVFIEKDSILKCLFILYLIVFAILIII